MREFDTIVMVDWSGAPDTGRTEKPNAIWAAVAHGTGVERPVYLRNAASAESWLLDLIATEREQGRRVLVGFDFPFGYPKGVARRIAGSDDPRDLHDWFARAFDDLPDGQGRFDIAARLNGLFPGDGPFWFNGLKRDIAGLPRKQPSLPADIPTCRAVERLAKGSFACWQMGGTGAVGSQVMTGMATLSHLRRSLGNDVAIWPYDTHDASVTLIEIWPTLIGRAVAHRMSVDKTLPVATTRKTGKPPVTGPIKDAAQVVTLAEVLRNAERSGLLRTLLDAPNAEGRREEGWILGAGYSDELTKLAMETDQVASLAPPPLSNDCFALPPGVNWRPVDKALDLLRHRLRPVTGTETIRIRDADGRILARDAIAARANPPSANSAVDGYGFAHSATGDGPQVLPLVAGRAAAGGAYCDAVPKGHAIRILTGAILPDGVDTVVLEEDTRADGTAVAFNGPVKPRANTRRAGEDMTAGDTALRSGHLLRPPDLALLSALGLPEIAVFKRLRVGVLSTGDELAEPGSTSDPARTYDANRPMLLALAARWGHAPVDLGRVRDDRAALRDRLDGAEADVILTSGGASAGDEDHVSALLRDTGSLTAWRIALKPGRPLALGMWNGTPVFGLPGNPVAAMVCALIFARPALSMLAGSGWSEPLAMTVPAAFEKRKKPGRREYLRARLGPECVEIFASEGSGRISGLSWADGLVELPDGAVTVRRGDPVRFLPYAGFGVA